MEICIVSKYPVICQGISSFIKEIDGIDITLNSINDLRELLGEKSNILPIICLFYDELHLIPSIISIKEDFPHIKMLIIDFNENEKMFFSLTKSCIEGYMIGNFSKEDLMYAISKITAGGKFYDRELLYKIAENNQALPQVIDKDMIGSQLTSRELQILHELSNGLSNFEIASSLKISENTVKKHVSNIFLKINVKDRSQAIIYAYNSGLLPTL